MLLHQKRFSREVKLSQGRALLSRFGQLICKSRLCKTCAMALTEEDFKALRLLMREEIAPFREEVNERFRQVDTRIEGLYARDEKR